MTAKRWFFTWLTVVLVLLLLLAGWTFAIDPYFHYHAPWTEHFSYSLYNQRSQNDGIARHLDFDSIITGTSMTENFKTSEMDRLFGTHAAKLPFSGASYKEINQALEQAFAHHPNLKLVIRCLDRTRFLDKADAMRTDLGTFPTYLYDSNPLNDGPYLWNRDLFFSRLVPMTLQRGEENQTPGLEKWDSYSRWQNAYTFGRHSVLNAPLVNHPLPPEKPLTEQEKQNIRENIEANVLQLAQAHPDTQFLLFFPPYSAAWWLEQRDQGLLEQTLEAESYILSLLLTQPNIQVFAFDTRTDLTTDLNHYKDTTHYAEWINSLILHWMKQGTSRLTAASAEEHINKLRSFYQNLDAQTLNQQTDYSEDWIAAAKVHSEQLALPPLQFEIAKTLPDSTPTTDPTQEWTLPDTQGRLYLLHQGRALTWSSQEPALSIEDAQGTVLAQFTCQEADAIEQERLLYLPDTLQANQLPLKIRWNPAVYELKSLSLS